MKLKELQASFDEWGRCDPLWAIATTPGKKGNRWDPDEFFETGAAFVQELMQFLHALPIRLTGDAALDFGCGVGRLTQPLANYFERVVGVDIAPSMIRLAETYNRRGERCDYILNERDDLRRFPDGCFDFVLSHVTLQHMVPGYSTAYIREFARVLAPGGVVVFQIPSERTVRPKAAGDTAARPQSPLAPDDPPMEMHGVPRSQVQSILKAGRLTTLDVSEIGSAGPDWTSYRYCATKSDRLGSAAPYRGEKRR